MQIAEDMMLVFISGKVGNNDYIYKAKRIKETEEDDPRVTSSCNEYVASSRAKY